MVTTMLRCVPAFTCDSELVLIRFNFTNPPQSSQYVLYNSGCSGCIGLPRIIVILLIVLLRGNVGYIALKGGSGSSNSASEVSDNRHQNLITRLNSQIRME